MRIWERARRKVGFHVFGDEEWEDEFFFTPPVGDIAELGDGQTRKERRNKKRIEKKKPTFGFGRVLDE